MKVRLCDEDRELFALPELLTFDPAAISVADMEWLSERYGFDPNDWPEPLQGRLTLEQAGDPDARPKPPPWRLHAVAWMLLRQNGVDASWEEAAAVRVLLMAAVPDEDVVPGKETPEPTPSPDSDASTTQPSATSMD